tara:strand:+ start:66 stop:218 length:153 start_codon:yes stop_codon:yes gene_type:complete
MNKIKKVSTFGIPALFGLGIFWFGNLIIKNEKKLEDRLLELKLELNNKTE